MFRKESNTRRRVAQLKTLGYSAIASPRGKTVAEYVVRARAGTARAAFDGAWASRFPGYSVRYIDCPVAN